MTHAPEPWTAIPDEDRYVIDHDGNGSVIGCEGLFKEDAERIVACVNFLQGIPTDFLIKHMERPDTKKFGALNYLVGLNRWTEQTRRSAPAP